MLVNISGFLYEVEKIDETHVKMTLEYGLSGPKTRHIREFEDDAPVYRILKEIVSKRDDLLD